MRKIFTLFIYLVIPLLTLHAQNLKVRKEVSCNNRAHSVQEVLNSGKVLLVIATATNCSNCGDFADDVYSFANINASKVTVWAAMNKLQGTPTCKEVEEFSKRYDWNENIYTFIDTFDHWTIGNKFTFFTVIDPATGNPVYQGTSYDQAISKVLEMTGALPIKSSTVTFDPKINSVFPNPLKDELKVNVQVADSTSIDIKVMDILGDQKIDFSGTADPAKREYSIDLKDYHLEKGLYFVRVEVDNTVRTFRLIKN